MVLLERIKLNKHAISLEDGKQPPYWPIYSLGPMELEILETYIKTHLKTEFIQPSKSFAGAPILFNKNPDGSFHLYNDYWDFNNLIINNKYSLHLIEKSLNWLHRAKRFI